MTDHKKIVLATNAFISSMRRAWVSTGGEGECPVKNLEHYPMQHRNFLIQSIGVAITVSNQAV